MTPTHIILIGGGGHALVVAEAAQLAGLTIAGYADDSGASLLSRLTSLTRLGTVSEIANMTLPRILCIGDLAARRTILAKYDFSHSTNVIHPRAFVSPTAALALGTFVGPGAIIHSHAGIGAHAIINSGAIIEHECSIGSNVHIAPGAVLAGNVSVGPHTLIGLGARILPGIRIGSNCTIGAGAVVTQDIDDDSTAIGVPARQRR